MCISRVGKVLDRSGNRATVRFLDDSLAKEIDVSMLKDVKRNSYVEVFAEVALGMLTPREARLRKKLWVEIRKKG